MLFSLEVTSSIFFGVLSLDLQKLHSRIIFLLNTMIDNLSHLTRTLSENIAFAKLL